MCGIAGCIGDSKDPELSYKILTKLFEKIETRGKDASGYWAVSKADQVFFHKEPIPASQYINNKSWQFVNNINPKLILCHAREASKGVGTPNENKNNHPFVSDCLSVGLVHNGRVPDSIYNSLKSNYKLISECDSEIFLRMFESETDRLSSIRQIWKKADGSHMAVAIGEQKNKDMDLWLFRNQFRTLWQIFLKQLNQMFFVSTKEIWMEVASYFDSKLDINLLPAPIELDLNKIYYLKIENKLLVQKVYEI